MNTKKIFKCYYPDVSYAKPGKIRQHSFDFGRGRRPIASMCASPINHNQTQIKLGEIPHKDV